MIPAEAKEIQLKLVRRVSELPALSLKDVRLVGGADCSYVKRSPVGYATIVVCEYPSLEVIEISGMSGSIDFPYVPGLLSFRELPLLERAWNALKNKPDILICDGQGRAHPRRFGLACHVGVALGVPTVGCAKSRLVGEHREASMKRGSAVSLYDGKERIGKVVRTRDGVKPLYVSIGHKVSLDQSVRLVLNLARNYRQPEVIRLAHQEVNRLRVDGGGVE